MNTLTRGQCTVLLVTAVPIVAVGVAGAVGTYSNARSVLGSRETAMGLVAAGEGATLVAALVMLVVTMLGQSAPRTVRAALWLLPLVASVLGLVIASGVTTAVVYGLTPLAMTASAEGISFLARRVVVYRTGVDAEALRRDAEVARRLNWHQAASDHHPSWVRRKLSKRASWSLAGQSGAHDSGLPDAIVERQRGIIVRGADRALTQMFGVSGQPEIVSGQPEIVSGHVSAEPDTVETPLPLTSPDTVRTEPDKVTDAIDPLVELVRSATGPSDLVRTLSGHGVPRADIAATAARLRPDLNQDSIRRTAKRLGDGPYL
jgi:hypothetical protein